MKGVSAESLMNVEKNTTSWAKKFGFAFLFYVNLWCGNFNINFIDILSGEAKCPLLLTT
jgi:hypothetical protein